MPTHLDRVDFVHFRLRTSGPLFRFVHLWLTEIIQIVVLASPFPASDHPSGLPSGSSQDGLLPGRLVPTLSAATSGSQVALPLKFMPIFAFFPGGISCLGSCLDIGVLPSLI